MYNHLLSTKPRKYKDVYVDRVEDHTLIYNPFSELGFYLLNNNENYIYNLINGNLTNKEILSILKENKIFLNEKEFIDILSNLLSYKIIYIGNPKTALDSTDYKTNDLEVWINLTNECNLRCKYCYIEKTKISMNKEVAEKTLLKIFSSAKKHGIQKIIFKFSGGEPLLELPTLLYMLENIRVLEYNFGIKGICVILTNGILLTKKTINNLKKYNIHYALSIDGLKKINDKTRIFKNGKGSFLYIEKAINNLINKNTSFSVSIVLTKNNIKNIPELTAYLLKKKIPFGFSLFRDNRFSKDNLSASNKDLIYYLKKAYKKIYDNIPKPNIINYSLDRISIRKPHLESCGVGKNYMVVTSSGNITSCHMAQDAKIGSINDNDLINTITEKSFIKQGSLTVDNKKNCSKCIWRYFCCGGCPLIAKNYYGTFLAPSPYCSIFKALIPEILKVNAKQNLIYKIKRSY